jgi:GDPmannose 4,6-dehydratase
VLGVDGQDGSYLAELLLDRGDQVVGWVPESIPVDAANVGRVLDHITLVEGDLGQQDHLLDCIEEYQPDEIYNLASPSSPFASWEDPIDVGEITALGVVRLLEAIRLAAPKARYYQASSSELFGDPLETPQNEDTPFCPRNPYGIAKLYAHWTTVRYRQRYGLFAVSGILFNHESPRRALKFVTRKITHTAACIRLGLADRLLLGDLEARRDWGFAGDYVRAIWLMLQQDTPVDYVIGTGKTHSVRDFCELAFGCLDLDYRDYVRQDKRFLRPTEGRQLVADPRKANKYLGWAPDITFEQLVYKMIDADLAALSDPEGKTSGSLNTG